ncbi:macrophage mannose receptor 1 isoform X2 [Kryptolebias marmoratus]|uniref:macrophage mannose receptor 1 isoform X2 n=1 Tax=Kryptolebias marmoratus TaxID=37003 RepID=UPI0007F90C64|nr:macrophage mannose receptor 1 isoform X2 [Kryptolebias marmoratus]
MNERRLFAMERTSLLSLILLSVFCPVESGEFQFFEQKMKYEDAKNHCKGQNSDLVTIRNSAEINELINKYSATNESVWIGLTNENEWIWHWSLPDQDTIFLNWSPGEPQTVEGPKCAKMDQNGGWFEDDCGTELSFICHASGDASSHIFVEELKTWRDAQSHCRGLLTELVSIQSAEENKAVLNISKSQSVWIGLFRDPWKWSDGSKSSFRFWISDQPSGIVGKKCVVAGFDQEGKWENRNCNNQYSFICYGQKSTPATTSSQTTHAGLTTTAQLSTTKTTILQNSPQGFTATFHSTVATTEQMKTTHVMTSAPTTASGMTTPNTTEFVPHPSSTELNNANTEMTVTPTQQPPTPAVNVTTSSASTLATQVGTSDQSTTLTSTVNSQSLQPALSYCREHYFDLVHIINKDIQDKVAQKTKSATSSHVWLGLRYSCNFKFWFWAGSTSGCYQNWVRGEGPDKVYECDDGGFSGAINATGGQQWIGLRETKKLNFVCNACAG